MFKKIIVTAVFLALIGALIFGAVNRTLAKNGSEGAGQGEYRSGGAGNPSAPAQTSSGSPRGSGWGAGRAYAGPGELANLPPASAGDLSIEEAAALLYMREEEKLAHDIYITLYQQWGLPVFQNISQSELAHLEAVKTLLDRYGLQDPASDQVGVFANGELQALYRDLAARGEASLAEALQVGAAIEEIDLLDLEERIAQTNHADIQQVFNNLLRGSRNHLRAFGSTLLVQTGETYVPQFLDAAAYQAIVGTGTETGGNGRGAGQAGGGYRGGRP